jgi:hypothetical protein
MTNKQKFILIVLSIFFVCFLVTGQIPGKYGAPIARDTDPTTYWWVMIAYGAIILIVLYRFLIAWSKKLGIKPRR